jgi:hypothetical protein
MSEAFRQAKHVFLAEIRAVEVHKGTTVAIDTVRATFTPLESFKGRPDALPAISSTTSDGVCGIGKLLLYGKRMIVFTQSSGHVGACDGTRAFDAATNAADIAALRAMRRGAQRKHAP